MSAGHQRHCTTRYPSPFRCAIVAATYGQHRFLVIALLHSMKFCFDQSFTKKAGTLQSSTQGSQHAASNALTTYQHTLLSALTTYQHTHYIPPHSLHINNSLHISTPSCLPSCRRSQADNTSALGRPPLTVPILTRDLLR